MQTHCNDREDQNDHLGSLKLLVGNSNAMHTTMSSHILKRFYPADFKSVCC